MKREKLHPSQIIDKTISYLKLKLSGTSKLLGSGSTSSDGAEIALGSNLEMSSATLKLVDAPTLPDNLSFSANKLIRRSTSDASDDGWISLHGGGGTTGQAGDQTRGGSVTVYGNEVSSVGGSVRVTLGNDADADFLVEKPDGNVALTVDGTTGATTLSQDLVFSADKVIRRDTSDGSDNGSIIITGGGGSLQSRGAHIQIYGNEHSGNPGDIRVRLGNVAGGDFAITDPTNTFNMLTASGTGITDIRFAATQVASADANTLDDYEEGTWTPVLSGSGGSSVTMSSQLGTYVKVGQMVFISCYLAMATMTSITGTVIITGIPFAALSTSNNGSTAWVEWSNLGASKVCVSVEVSPGSTTLNVRGLGAANTNLGALVQADITGSTVLRFGMAYRANA